MKITPASQCEFVKIPMFAFASLHPTLSLLNDAYGSTTASAWLVIQLHDLSEFCGCKDKLSIKQLRDTADLIATLCPHLKTSELLLFFGWMKSGKYGKFYGSLDPMVVTTSLQEFLRERATYYDKLDNRCNEQRQAEYRKHERFTPQEWEERKKRATTEQNQ